MPDGVSPYDRAYLLGEELTILTDFNFPYLVLSVTGDLAECNNIPALASHRNAHLIADLHPVHLAERQ